MQSMICWVTVRNVRHVHLAVEGQHVVLAHREEVDVFHDHHLIVGFLEEGVGEHLVRVLVVSACEHLHGLGHPERGFLESFAVGVLTQEAQDVIIMAGERFESLLVFCLCVHYYR